MNFLKIVTISILLMLLVGCGSSSDNEIIKTHKSEFNSQENNLITQLQNKKFYSYLSDSKRET